MRIMKIGDYVTIQEIADQSEYRWVVLSDFEYHDYGGYEDIENLSSKQTS